MRFQDFQFFLPFYHVNVYGIQIVVLVVFLIELGQSLKFKARFFIFLVFYIFWNRNLNLFLIAFRFFCVEGVDIFRLHSYVSHLPPVFAINRVQGKVILIKFVHPLISLSNYGNLLIPVDILLILKNWYRNN